MTIFNNFRKFGCLTVIKYLGTEINTKQLVLLIFFFLHLSKTEK